MFKAWKRKTQKCSIVKITLTTGEVLNFKLSILVMNDEAISFGLLTDSITVNMRRILWDNNFIKDETWQQKETVVVIPKKQIELITF